MSVDYSAIYGGVGPYGAPGYGLHNTPDDPQIIYYNYNLMSTSPCIDKGSDANAPTDGRGDILFNPRVDISGIGNAGTLTDIGAYEYQPGQP